MIINISPRFKRSYKSIPKDIQTDFDLRLKVFIKNPFQKNLRTHKLKGTLKNYWSFSLKNGFRVLFEFSGKESINLLTIGPHDKYSQWK